MQAGDKARLETYSLRSPVALVREGLLDALWQQPGRVLCPLSW